MNRSNTRRQPILLYCSRATQTQDDYEAEYSDFLSYRLANGPALIATHYSPPSHSRHSRAAASGIYQRQLTVSSEEEPSQTQRHRQPSTGLGQSNIVNTVGAAAMVSRTKVIRIFLARSNANGEFKCQGDPSHCKKPSLKRQGSMDQDASNERPSTRRHSAPCDDDNMGWVRREIASIKETLEEMASEAREDRRRLISTLEEFDSAGIKESLDDMTHDAREERDNLHNMLAELLAEVQERE